MTKRKQISSSQKILLWARAGGRCEFEGCNEILYRDTLLKNFIYNFADRGHIIADSPNGPRGDKLLSKQLDVDINNLMLLCKKCHKRIDINEILYTVEKLQKMKKQHEDRIERVTGISENNRTKLIIYSANIGSQSNSIIFNNVECAVIADDMYPDNSHPIDLSLYGHMLNDKQENFWKTEAANLENQFREKIKDRVAEKTEKRHFSVFAIAPIPLLIKLGSLLTDKTNVQVYQKIREPDTWYWQEDTSDLGFSIVRPFNNSAKVALILSLSSLIPDVDVLKVFGNDVSLWHITIKRPNNDCIRNKCHLSAFREIFRTVLQEIKTWHGAEATINIFPAVPVSIAIEIGRVWMPKADLPLIIYDRNREDNLSFIKTIAIGVEND